MALRAEAQVLSGFVSACSTAQSWEQAVDEVAEKAGTGFECGMAFISSLHVDSAQGPGLGAVLDALREKLGAQVLIGCAVTGALGQAAGPDAVEYGGGLAGEDWPPIEVERGFCLSVGLLRKAGATPFFLGTGTGGEGDVGLLGRMKAAGDVRSVLLLADPFAEVDELLRTLGDYFPGATKAGGLSTALQVQRAPGEMAGFMPSIAIATEGNSARMCNQGAVGLLLTEVAVHTVVCQGCCGVGPKVNVTGVQGPVCDGIGGRPAREALQLIFSNVDPQTREKMQKFLLLGLGNPGESGALVDDGDWRIRPISGVTESGGLVVGPGLQEGMPMRFHVRDVESANKDRQLMLKRYRLEKAVGGNIGDAMGAFLFTCNGRGESLYGQRHVDARAAAEVLGDEVGTRVAGFFCNGEIGAPGLAVASEKGRPEAEAPEKGTAMRPPALHGFTAVYALLVPAEAAPRNVPALGA